MQEGYQPTIESSAQTGLVPDGGFGQMEQFVRWANTLEARVSSVEGALRGLGDSLGQMQEQVREINDHYKEILDKHDQLVVYIQSSMQYCENKENIDALFEASEANSLAATGLGEKMAALNETSSQATREFNEQLAALSEANNQAAREFNEQLAALAVRIAEAEDAARGKMPMSQGEQLLKVLKLHHGKLAELAEMLNG